jgi:hypothetical protein
VIINQITGFLHENDQTKSTAQSVFSKCDENSKIQELNRKKDDSNDISRAILNNPK